MFCCWESNRGPHTLFFDYHSHIQNWSNSLTFELDIAPDVTINFNESVANFIYDIFSSSTWVSCCRLALLLLQICIPTLLSFYTTPRRFVCVGQISSKVFVRKYVRKYYMLVKYLTQFLILVIKFEYNDIST